MVDFKPDEIGNYVSGWFTGSLGVTIVKYVAWGLVIACILGFFFLIYLIVIHKYKARIFRVVGSGSDMREFAIGKSRFDMARKTKDGSWKFLISRKTIEPFDSKYIYPGNKIYVYEINDKFLPGKINCGKESFAINPVPYHIRKKAELELQQLEQDFSKINFWEANKIYIYMLIGSTVVIVFAGFVIWLAFKKTDQIVPALEGFGNVVRNFNTVPGQG